VLAWKAEERRLPVTTVNVWTGRETRAQLLCDLHVIAQREDDITAFTARVRELRTRYAKRPSLMDRLDKAGLP
jgi:hypothetical protein